MRCVRCQDYYRIYQNGMCPRCYEKTVLEETKSWRKEMYQWMPEVSGIYMLYCNATKMKYIGASENVYKRLRHHLHDLVLSTKGHLMHDDYIRFGPESISCKLVEIVVVGNLAEREARYMRSNEGKLYNTHQFKHTHWKWNNG